MALETERSSPNGASSPGPSRDIQPSTPHSSSSAPPGPSPPLGAASSPPISRFEPETAHTTGGPPPPPPPPPPILPALMHASSLHDTYVVPRLPHPSPSASASPCSPSSSYYAGSPPLAPPIFHLPPPPHHPYQHFAAAAPPPHPSIVAPQAILAAGVALGGLALGGGGDPVCGWPPDFVPSSPARPHAHHHPHLLAHHHALLRLRPEEALSTPRGPRQHPQAVPPPPPTPLPFSVDNILRPAFGLRAVLEEEERGRRRLLLGEEAPPPPPQKKKKKPPEASRDAVEGGQRTAGVPQESSPAKAEGVDAAEGGKAAPEPKLPNPENGKDAMLWPAWVYCTRYSDRPSSGPRSRRVKRKERSKGEGPSAEEKRPRTAFSAEQLSRLKQEFAESRYLTEKRRQTLARDLRLNESQIKIWFQNKRAKIKKASGQKGGLALQLMAQGLYNHSTVPVDEDDEELEEEGGGEERRKAEAAAAGPGGVGPPPMMVGTMPLDTRPPPLLVER